MWTAVKTPCIGICSTALGDDVCRGCKRYAQEVIDWNSYSIVQQQRIEERLVTLLTQLIQNKIHVTDEALLRWQISVQAVDVPKHRNVYCQAYALIKAGAKQISTLEAFGLCLQPEYRSQSVAQICHDIDAEFYALSVAYYQRAFRPAFITPMSSS